MSVTVDGGTLADVPPGSVPPGGTLVFARDALASPEHPRRQLPRILRWHLPVLACWTMAWFVLLAPRGGIAWKFFLQGGSLLFGGHDSISGHPGGLHLYANYPQLQIGPFAFASAQVLRHLGPDNGLLMAQLIMTAMGLFIVCAIEQIALIVRPELARSHVALQQTLLTGGALFMIAWVELTVAYGHLDDALALLAATAALWVAIRGRPALTGLFVGLAIDAKPWALIFLPLLLLAGDHDRARSMRGAAPQAGPPGRADAPGRAEAPGHASTPGLASAPGHADARSPAEPHTRSRAPAWAIATACALAATAAGWLPFFVADPATMTAAHYTIRNMPDSALRALGFSTPRTPPWDRTAQIVGAWLLGALAVWRRRGAAVILLAAGARIALDPGTHGYYTAAVMAGALLWDTLGARRPFPLWTLLSFCALSVVPLVTANAVLRGTIRLDLVIAFTLAVLLAPAGWYWQPRNGPASRPATLPHGEDQDPQHGQHAHGRHAQRHAR